MNIVLRSDYRRLCRVVLPDLGRQSYMHSFDLADPVMADGFEDYHNAVLALCLAAGATKGTAHMTVDEKRIEAGHSQRRPGPHVDGCFHPPVGSWAHRNTHPELYEPGQSGPSLGGGWGHGGGWLHTCNDIPGPHIANMAVIVAADQRGCRAWRGDFEGTPAADGDLSHISDQLGEGTVLEAGVGYLLSPDCVHESLLMERATRRTFLRIALPLTFRF